MKDLYLLNYNNYYNRTIKKFDTLQEYAGSGKVVGIVSKVNFVENDGINTTQIINADFDMIDTPDYLVVANTDNSIHSRWFVLECAKLRSGQYQLQLKRDVIADSAEDVLNATSFIYKGTLGANDPLIYNSEGSQVNQIKQEEILLKDYTKNPWIVAYISPDVAKDHPKITGSTEGYYDIEYNTLEEYPYYKYSQKTFFNEKETGLIYATNIYISQTMPVQTIYARGRETTFLSFDKNYNYSYWGNFKQPKEWDSINNGCYLYAGLWNDSGHYPGQVPSAEYRKKAIIKNWHNQPDSLYQLAQEPIADRLITQTVLDKIYKEENKIIKVGEKFYKVSIQKNNCENFILPESYIGSAVDKKIQQECIHPVNKDGPTSYQGGIIPWYTTAHSFYPHTGESIYEHQYNGPNSALIAGTTYKIVLTEVPVISSTFEYNFTDVDLSNNETPYGIICLPYSDNFAINDDQGTWPEQPLSKESYLKIMQALGSIDGLLYDMQILPYCPIKTLNIWWGYHPEGQVERDQIRHRDSYNVIRVKQILNPDAPESEQQKKYITSILVSKTPNISFNIDQSITINELKLQNETDMWRLVSPNYAGNFDFNATKFYKGNNKTINYFHVDCSFKPYNPYIHVAPEWKGLYGKDYNDAKGLICGGDYSIDRINDQWVSYQYNNKNFQLQFDRQIESMEKQYGWGMANQAVNTVGGIAGGAAAGAVAGSIVPGLGTVAGAVIGGISGVVQGGLNMAQSTILGRDSIDAAKDQFNYNLENIQARPYGLTKVSALNSNNKLFPFLEHYSCTEQEKDAVKNRINFEGMTVMAIRPISSVINNSTVYKENYVRAKIIRMNEDFKHDAHYVNEINKELAMGVYMNV